MNRRVIAGRKVGSLEEAVLRQLWQAEEPLSGREIVERLPGPARAYTTVMTVLGRLMEKGLVERIAVKNTYRYRAAGSQEQLTAQAISNLLSSAKDPTTVLAYFVEDIHDPSLLSELASLLEQVLSGSSAGDLDTSDSSGSDPKRARRRER
ncbi:MAG: BlaI/MecI/CopY family transcriptional regulator [Actinobacteria bacterium]|jgi:predicted transcriptional regulator|nr:BlaI/MecI/CopY family transcriptional regulator [Actinomycetota bacterium]